MNNVLLDFLGYVQFESRWVADVEFKNPVALFLQPTGFTQNHATYLVTHVIQLGGFEIVLHKPGSSSDQ